MPSRLLAAFPAGVPIRRLPLDQAIACIEERLATGAVAKAELVS